jgi:uncharacterized membrane protein (DUF106 family)
MVFSDLLNPIFSPLLKLPPLLAIMIISFVISLFIVLIYRKLTDQSLMKRLKSEIKELQKEMKTLKDKPDKMMQVQRRAMETNTKYMMHSMKPTLITFLPIILIFGWLNAHMAYYPIVEDTEFSIDAIFDEGSSGTIRIEVPQGVEIIGAASQEILDNEARWVLAAEAGEYSLEYDFEGTEFSHKLIVTQSQSDRRYAKPELRPQELGLEETTLDRLVISNKKVQPLKSIPLIGSIPWIGGFGWLGTYILFSIAFSITLRKLLKVY